MQVLYFHQHFSTPSGSTGTRSYENCRRLIQRGHTVTMVCGSYGTGSTGLSQPFHRGKRRGDVDGIDVIQLELPYANHFGLIRRSYIFLKFALRSVWIALTEDYDLVFATSTPLTAAIPGIFARVLRRKPFVFEVRDLWPELPKAMGVITNRGVLAMLAGLERSAYWAAHSCIGLSPGICAGIEKVAGAGKPVVLIPNGCDLDVFSGDTDEAPVVLRKAGDSLVAVFTGAHGLANGLDAVLDTALELKKRMRLDISIVFIGDGQQKPALHDRCEAQQLSNVSFHDPMPKTKLAATLADVDVGLMILANVPAFYYGTSPNKFFDYIALGMPVLNNYPGWLADMIESEDIGVVVPPENPVEFAAALEYLADNPGLRAEMGRRARSFAERKFNRNDLSELWVTEIERVASN